MDPTSHFDPPTTLGPYRLEDLLGQGGMGEVYRAYDQRLDRRVAIKHIRPDAARKRTTEQRFRREAATVARLSHPAIVQIYDVVETDAGHWIVMEYIEGPTLTSMTAGGPLDLDLALTYGRQVAEGLAEAHGKGILHRDLKTENVMVTPSGHAKILDFGLAKRIDQPDGDPSLTARGEIMGTGRSMSPEQARGLDLDHRSDLFSLGVLLYEILTGVPPFRGRTVLDTLSKVVSHHQAPVVERLPSLPKDLSDLVDRLLEKAPELRPRSAEEVAARLEEMRLRHVSGASAAAPGYADATTFLSEMTPLPARPGPDPPAERGLSDSIFHAVAVHRSLWIGLLAAVVVTSGLGWVLSTGRTDEAGLSGQTGPSPTAVSERGDAEITAAITAETSAQEALRIGQEHLRFYDLEGRLDTAIEALKAAITRDPDSAAAYADLALAYWRTYLIASKDPIWLTQAEALAQKAITTDAFYSKGFAALALAQLYSGQVEEAKQSIDKSLVLDPTSATALIALGKYAERTSDETLAEEAYAKALAEYPEHREALDSAAVFELRRGNSERAEELMEKSLEVHPLGVSARLNLSTLHHLRGDFASAVRVIQELLEFNPHPTAYSNLGTYLFYQGLYHDSAEAFEKATRYDLGSNSFFIWSNLGDAQRWAGRTEAARRSFARSEKMLSKLIEASPGNAELRSHLALVQAKIGDAESAKTILDSLTNEALSSRDPRLPARLARVAEILGLRDTSLRLLVAAVEHGYPLSEIELDPELTKLRADARFHDIRDLEP